MTRFIDVPTMARLVQAVGVAPFIGELADAIQDDFVRWSDFDKSTRVTVFDSVGFALEDYSTLRYVLAQAERRQLGMAVNLVPGAEDPKDLFCHTRAETARPVMRRVA